MFLWEALKCIAVVNCQWVSWALPTKEIGWPREVSPSRYGKHYQLSESSKRRWKVLAQTKHCVKDWAVGSYQTGQGLTTVVRKNFTK